ncbi:MAG: hypothetical protein GWP17_00020 [Aquificales bacterium]|nr:hypothetical protein [Aquificales bacterium]
MKPSHNTAIQHIFKLSQALFLAIMLWSVLWSALTILPVYAQTVTSAEPIANALNVEAATNITVTFDTDIDSTTVNSATLTLRGEQTGIYTGTYSFPAPDVVVFDPTSTFKSGEVLWGNASSQIMSTGGIKATPYVWQFTTAAQDGTGDGRCVARANHQEQFRWGQVGLRRRYGWRWRSGCSRRGSLCR